MNSILSKSVKVLLSGLLVCLVSPDMLGQGYVVNWTDPSTYTISCGSTTGNKWSIQNRVCTYDSPNINSGGSPAEPDKRAVISVSVNPTGNLDNDDTLIIRAYNEGTLQTMLTVVGDTVSSVFTASFEIMVPAASNSTVEVIAINNQSSEKWRIMQEGISVSFPAAPLPVELELFKGRMKNNTAVLEWVTRAEVNNDYFTVERSDDGWNYVPVARIKGKGTTTTASYYSWHEDLDDGQLAYYRLKQTDFNGDFKYMGRTITLRAKTRSLISVYPNPVPGDKFHILVNNCRNEEVAVELRDIFGKIVHQELFYPESDSEDLVMERRDIRIKKGLYMLTVRSRSDAHSERLFIQH